jgi:hypothetical protein
MQTWVWEDEKQGSSGIQNIADHSGGRRENYIYSGTTRTNT